MTYYDPLGSHTSENIANFLESKLALGWQFEIEKDDGGFFAIHIMTGSVVGFFPGQRYYTQPYTQD